MDQHGYKLCKFALLKVLSQFLFLGSLPTICIVNKLLRAQYKSCKEEENWEGLFKVTLTDVSTTWAEVIFRVFLRTTPTRTIVLHLVMIWLLGSNHLRRGKLLVFHWHFRKNRFIGIHQSKGASNERLLWTKDWIEELNWICMYVCILKLIAFKKAYSP